MFIFAASAVRFVAFFNSSPDIDWAKIPFSV